MDAMIQAIKETLMFFAAIGLIGGTIGLWVAAMVFNVWLGLVFAALVILLVNYIINKAAGW